MVQIEGTGMVWEGLSLWGVHQDPTSCTPNIVVKRAGVGIKITKPSSGSLLNTGKLWFPSILIDNCATGILADGALSADSCAFGYANIRDCHTAVHLNGSGATMFTFGYVHTPDNKTIFKVSGGGRIYVHSVNIVFGPDIVLDVVGGDLTNSFFHINGVTGDGNNTAYTLLRHHDPGSGSTHVRFTNAHLLLPPNIVRIDIDRVTGGGTTGQTVVEIVGSRGLNALENNVVIKGASSSKPSRLIVRDSELARDIELVASASSSNYTDNRVKNWLFHTGLETDIQRP
jgi:hypothetical protein